MTIKIPGLGCISSGLKGCPHISDLIYPGSNSGGLKIFVHCRLSNTTAIFKAWLYWTTRLTWCFINVPLFISTWARKWRMKSLQRHWRRTSKIKTTIKRCMERVQIKLPGKMHYLQIIIKLVWGFNCWSSRQQSKDYLCFQRCNYNARSCYCVKSGICI